jgi:hypothetical protein
MGGGATQTQIRRDVTEEQRKESVKEPRRNDRPSQDETRRVAAMAASAAAEPPPGGPGGPGTGFTSLEQAMTQQFDAQFGAPSGLSGMKASLESVKKSGDSGSEYNDVLAQMEKVNVMWADVTTQQAFDDNRADLSNAYSELIDACNTYLRTHKGFRWTSVGRHRVRRITEIAQFAAERKGAIDLAPAPHVEEPEEPPQAIPAPPQTTIEPVAPIPAGPAGPTETEVPEAPAPAIAAEPAAPEPIPEAPWRANFLRTGTKEDSEKRSDWLLDLVDSAAVRAEMDTKYLELGYDQFVREATMFNTRLDKLRTLCGNYLRENQSGNSILRSSAFFEKVHGELFQRIADNKKSISADYTKDMAESDIAAAFDAVMEDHADETQTYASRRERLLSGDMSLAAGAIDKNQTILGYLHDTDMEEGKFEEKSSRYRKNVSAHLNTARRAFDARFQSPKARETALGRFVDSMGGRILNGSLSGAEMNAGDMARLAHIKVPEAFAQESDFRRDMKEVNFKEEWLPLLYNDYGKLAKPARAAADLKAMMLDISTTPDRIKALPAVPAGDAAAQAKADIFAEFCSWEGFAGLLKGYEKDIKDAVSAALSSDKLKVKIKSVKKEGSDDKEAIYAKNADDLSHLSPARLDEAYAPLRLNILTNITEWESIGDAALKKEMVSDLVLCPTREEFTKKLAAARAHGKARARADNIRFEASLMAPAIEKRELHRHALYYNYTDVKANTSILKKEDRDTARLDRLRAGTSLREQLAPEDYAAIRNVFLTVYSTAYDKATAAYTKEADKGKVDYEVKINKYLNGNLKTALQLITERLSKLSSTPKTLISALGSASGVMELLLSEFATEAVEGGGQFSETFTSENRDTYERKLTTTTQRAMFRQTQLDNALGEARNLPEERKQLFRANMRDMLVNLAPVEPEPFMSPADHKKSDQNKAANQDRFGAVSWGNALGKLRDMISAETVAAAPGSKSDDLHENSKLAAELMAARLEALKQKTTATGESIFEYALPLLRKRPATARILMLGSEGEFAELEARLTAPLTLIAEQYSTISLIARQMVLRHFDKMAEPEPSAKNWTTTFQKTYEEINKHEAVTSIDKIYEELLQKKLINNKQDMMRHFPVILEATGGDFEKLAAKGGLDEYQKRYNANIKVFNAFWATKADDAPGADKSAAAADTVGFTKFVERYMFTLDSAPAPAGKTKGKTQAAAPQADSAYDHAGLLKAYRQGSAGGQVYFDTAFLNYMFEAYGQERSNSLQALGLAKQVMNRRRTKRDAIDERRAAGAKETAGDDAVTRRLREDRYAGLSPLMAGLLEHERIGAGTPEEKAKKRTARMNGLRDAMETSEVKKTSKSINEKVVKPAEASGPMSGAVRSSVLERRLIGADKDDKFSTESANLLTALEARLQTIELAGRARRLSRAEIEDFMPYVQVFGTQWQKTGIDDSLTLDLDPDPDPAPDPGAAYDAELQSLYVKYAGRRNAITQLEGIPIAGVALASERDESVRDLTYGMYVLGDDTFAALSARRKRYFTNAQLCEAMFSEEAGKHNVPAERAAKNLREYFGSELQKEAFDPETLREATGSLLADADTRDYISGEAAKDPLAPEKLKALSTAEAFDALEDYEMAPRGKEDRRAFEQLLRDSKRIIKDKVSKNTYWVRYSKLELDEKRLLALALTLPGVGRDVPEMPNAGIGASAERKAAMRGKDASLASYLEGDEFKPRIDYSFAIHTLTDRDHKVKSEVFENAYNFAQLCRLQRADNQGALSHLLSDPAATLSYNKYFKAEDAKKTIGSFKDFVAALSASADADTKRLSKADAGAKKKLDALSAMDAVRSSLLISALQDRTKLDYTTKMTAWNRKGGKYHPFVNESGQDDLLDNYVKADSAAPASGELTNAYLVLHSYQVRDDAKLDKAHAVRKDELADGAIKRKSAVDWELLDRALVFVKKAEDERTRIMSLGNLVPAENADAKRMFAAIDGMDENQVDATLLEGYFITYAKQDKKLPELAGYLSLGAQEKKLFIKALGRRAALDITKRGIMLNRLGLGGRGYANQGARDDLTDDYVNNGDVALENTDCKNALRACFSAQIDDSAEIKEPSGGESAKALSAGSKRDTAVDWKLFGRALQFVRRTSDERNMYQQDRMMYEASGDVAEGGEFKYSSGNLRQNVHDAGNRFTRFLGRRFADRVKDQIPTPLLMLARAAMPIQYANKMSKLEFLASEDEGLLDELKGYTDTGAETLESLLETAEDFPDLPEPIGAKMPGLAGAYGSVQSFAANIAGGDIGENLSTATEYWGHISMAYDSLSTLYTAGKALYDSYKANKEAEEAQGRDDQKQKTISQERGKLSAHEQSLLEEAIARNERGVAMGGTMASKRKIDEVINSTTEIVGGIVDKVAEGTGLGELPLGAIVEEAGHFINFVRSYFEDKKNVAQYFNSQSESQRLKAALKNTAGIQLDQKDIDSYSDEEMMRRGMGYGNYTEMASIVGLAVTRSILFSAGKQGSREANRVRAVAVLVMLDCKELVGKQDPESAEQLYSAIMASDYR